MKRLTFKIFLGLGVAYFALHLFLSSSLVQNRIVKEIKGGLQPIGLSLSIESIDISFFLPKIYLNRVVLSTEPNAAMQLPNPLSIERIKISVNPLSVFYGQLTLSEVSLYQPKIVLQQADLIFKKAQKIFESKSKWKVQGSKVNVEIQKMGVVDAFVLVTMSEPKIGVDSGRLTLFVEKSARNQFSITSNFSNLTLDRGTFRTVIRSGDFDFDVTEKSVRANRVSIDSDWMSLNLKGATSLPFNLEKGPDSFRAVYQIKTSLAELKDVEELRNKFPKKVSGIVESSGSLEKAGSGYVGSGKIGLQNVDWDGYQIGNSETKFEADGKRVSFKDLLINVESGRIQSPRIVIDFKERSPFEGELEWSNVELHQVLSKLKVLHEPLYVGLNGKAKAKGFLSNSFSMQGEVTTDLSKLVVVGHAREPVTPSNTVISVEQGKVTSSFNVGASEGNIKTQIEILDGTLIALATWGPKNPFHVEVEGKDISLTKLKNIQELAMGGTAELKARVELQEGEPVISGGFDLKNGEISDVVLGSVRGNVRYENELLVFESLELPSLETIRSNGFVDFKPKETRYKFQITSKRASVDQVFQFFRKTKLEFTPPTGGELAATVTLEGGHDSNGIQVTASGTVRGIKWFDENWLGGSVALVYRNDYVQISRGTLTKPKGAIGFQGVFKGNKSKLKLQSYGLKLEDLDHVRGAPVAGEIVGQLNLEGSLELPTGQGELKLIKTSFRNQSLGDSNISVRETPQKTQFIGSLFGGALQGRLVSSKGTTKERNSEVLLNFEDCNLTPLLAMWSGKDLPAFGMVKATGDIELNGNLNVWNTLKGSGTLSDVQLDLKTAPVKNRKPISFVIENGAVKIPPFELAGQDSVVSGTIDFRPGDRINGSLDAKLDLLYLQPFIPGLEYGTGKVTAGIRLSGKLPQFDLLGNVTVEDGSFRIQNLAEDFRNVRSQLLLTQDRIGVDRFEATHGGGNLKIKGGVLIDHFTRFSPDLQLVAKSIGFRQQNYLAVKVSGELGLKGKEMPYLLSGDCYLDEGRLSDFNIPVTEPATNAPTLRFDMRCKADRKFIVDTDVMQAEWKGDFHLMGDNNHLGLLGTAESVKGAVFFKETRFDLVNGTVKFEDREKINPRFNVSGKSFVKEQRAQVPIEYEISLSAYGTPSDYKIRLSSVPALTEPDIIALLVLGGTTQRQDDNYMEFGSTLMGKSPLQSKIQNELGVNIKVNMQRSNVGNSQATGSGTSGGPATGGLGSETTVPAVQIQKEITNKTKLSYSNTLDQSAMKEFKVEQLLDENFTVNASAVDKFRGSTQNESVKSYGLDLRYRFQFE